MIAKQLSVFIENRQGRLGEVLEDLKKNNVNILSLSLADTTEYGLLRLMVSDPVKGKEVLSNAGFSTMLTDILVIKIDHKAGSLQSLLEILASNNVNIEYMYGLSVEKEKAYVVLKASDIETASKLLLQKGAKLLSTEEVANI